MPFGLGFFAVAGAGGAAGSFDLLETQVLGSTQASVEFTSLNTKYASTYKHLQLRAVVRSDRAGLDRDLAFMQLNSDTGANYNSHGLVGAGNAVYSFNSGQTTVMELFSYLQAATSPAGAYSTYVIDLLDAYDTNKFKTIRSLSGGTVRSAESGVALSSGLYRSTSALTAIKFYGSSANLSANSRFSLYGVKGS